MKTAYRILPCYTGDVSGVCSALFELGGMVVIHDPSGCNSTYNTHDETRWYDRDSLIFLSGFSETDAILGADEKLISEVVETAESLMPKFIALVSSPVPFMNGTDFPAIARIIEAKTGIPCFFIPTNGMHDYVAGAGGALLEIARRYAEKNGDVIPKSVNVLGMTPLDFAADGSEEALRRILAEQGYSVLSCFAMGSELSDIARAGNAEVNVVVSAAGLAAAEELRRRFGTPFVCGIPVNVCGAHGGASDGENSAGARFRDELAAASETGENRFPCLYRGKPAADGECGEAHAPHVPQPLRRAEVTLIGEPITMGSIAAEISRACGARTRVLCPLEASHALLAKGDKKVRGEDEAEELLKTAEIVLADPFYRYISPEGVKFYELPHQAFSGRNGHKSMKNLFTAQFQISD